MVLFNGDLHAGISSLAIDGTFGLGEDITLANTYAYLMAPFMMAFTRPSPGQPHPAPWKATKGGLSFDISADLKIPSNLGESADDRLNIARTIIFLIRLGINPAARISVLSNYAFTDLSKIPDNQAELFPYETQFRSFSLVTPMTPKTAPDKLRLEAVSLKRSGQLTEKWVQEQIAEDPKILTLGDLDLKDKERIQPNAGRLDLLLQDPETLKRYEVEIQLGATDESHIIRTIEYWDIERKRYPQYEHAAVIVAEDITTRFLNVIQLFNGAIPLIALKMTAYRVGDQYALTFVKVLDEVVYGPVDEDEPLAEPTDRGDWEKRASSKTLAATDNLLKLVNEVEPKAILKYNKHYIGLDVNGSPMNFVTFMPRHSHVIMTIKLPQTKEIDDQLEEAGIETLAYQSYWRQYRLRIESSLDDKQREMMRQLIHRARESFGSIGGTPG